MLALGQLGHCGGGATEEPLPATGLLERGDADAGPWSVGEAQESEHRSGDPSLTATPARLGSASQACVHGAGAEGSECMGGRDDAGGDGDSCGMMMCDGVGGSSASSSSFSSSSSGVVMVDELEELGAPDLGAWSLDSPVSSPPSEPVHIMPPPSADSTLLVLDYDDTLFPTSRLCDDKECWSKISAGEAVSDDDQKAIFEIESEALELVALCKRHGQCVLLTNAERSWLSMSLTYYMPRLMCMLSEGVDVVFGRDFQEGCPLQPSMWKQRAFAQEVRRLRERVGDATIQLVSIGDSEFERGAAQSASEEDGNVQLKTVKMLDLPTYQLLSQQLSQICTALPSILKSSHPWLDVDMEMHEKKASQQEQACAV